LQIKRLGARQVSLPVEGDSLVGQNFEIKNFHACLSV
jgi:hypothetical protein